MAVSLALAAFVQSTALALATDRPRVLTHQSFVEDVLNDAKLPIDDPRAMLDFVLGTLSERVKVYPTENYYYFNFINNGVRYAGNIRLDAEDRD